MKYPFERAKSHHLWIIVLLFIILSLLHYSKLIFPNSTELNSLLGLQRHAIERILFLAPITYAAIIFGFRVSLITISAAFILMMPRVLFISNFPMDALLETCFAIGVGGLSVGELRLNAKRLTGENLL